MATLQEIVAEVNRRAAGQPIGGLQDWRKANRGLGRKAGPHVFGAVRGGDDGPYAFHIGGRTELQFNVGIEKPIDGSDLRFGVAFSFEPSQSLPDIDVLLPRVTRFNEYLRADPEDLAGLRMWHHPPDGGRVIARPPSPIEERLVRRGVFVFLGTLGRSASPDYDAILDTLDRLLPLYHFVESGDGRATSPAEAWAEPPLRLRPAAPTGWTTATAAARTLDVELRHRALQAKLCAELVAEFGDGCVGSEHPAPGGGMIDVIVRTSAVRTLFEIKTASTARACIREALGQVLDYACWPGGPPVDRVVVVGPEPPTAVETAYLERLNQRFPVPLEYRRVALEGA